jgi:hypothetical protein
MTEDRPYGKFLPHCSPQPKYGFPPDLQDAAVKTVLQQAEALSAEWAVA